MAICRYKTNDGAVEHAIYQDGRVCPLRVLGVELADDVDITQLGKQWFRDLPVPQDAHWVTAPDRLLPPCLLYTSPSPRDLSTSRMPSSA